MTTPEVFKTPTPDAATGAMINMVTTEGLADSTLNADPHLIALHRALWTAAEFNRTGPDSPNRFTSEQEALIGDTIKNTLAALVLSGYLPTSGESTAS